MADTTFSQSGQYFSISTPLAEDALILRGIEGEEGMSQLFVYRLKLIAKDNNIDFTALVGKKATITITFGEDNAHTRHIDGYLTRFELTHYDDTEQMAYYEAELRPWLYLLTLSGDCRIFQAKSVPDIVQAVCNGAGFTDITNSVTGTYAAVDYCVQYGESDFNFVSRLLEREGIFYFFEHSSGTHKLVLGDDASVFSTCPSVSDLNYWPQAADDDTDDMVLSVRYEQHVATKTFGVNSFNFEAPATALYASSDGTKGTGSRTLYTGNYIASSDGERYAKILQQAVSAPAELIHGTGQLRSLCSGHTFTLAKHPRDALNQTYVVHRLKIEAQRDHYKAFFEAFPSSINYRPHATAVAPRIHSTQTAIVVGKSGEEIWVDSYGRVKVQFHWDRVGTNDENSSCWIRVAQSWAGKSYGTMFLPRIGQEVVVTFLDGDPDKPLITGAVYNADQTIPYAQPDNSTRSTIKTLSSKGGTGMFNELRFEDKKDSEEIFLQAQKDMNVNIINNLTTTITGNEVRNVSKGKDANGADKGGQRTTTIAAAEVHTSQDTYSHTVDKTRTIDIKGTDTITNEDDLTHTAKKNYTLEVDGNLTITVKGDVVFKGNTLSFESTGTTIAMKSSTDTSITAGAALNVKSTGDTGITADGAVNVKSTMAMALKSSMGMDLAASLALTAKGLSSTVKGDASAELSSGGATTVGGSMIKIG